MSHRRKKSGKKGYKSPLYIQGHRNDPSSRVMWGRWDLNPDQRVSTTRGATPRELTGQRSSYSSPVSNPSTITPN
jgi:hypothetical protein